LANKYSVSIQRTTYSQKKILELTALLYSQFKSGLSEINIQGTIYKIDPEKLDKFKGSAMIIFKAAVNKGGDKITDITGDKLEISKPSYDKQINELVENNLQYVKDLSNDQKKKVIDQLSKGMKQGKTFNEMSDDIVNEIKGMTRGRAKLIARNEVNRAVAVSMEKTMKYNGFANYFYITAGDKRVSEICKINSFGNKEGTGNLIRHLTGHGPIPIVNSHIACRCLICKCPD
jgi:SPP1 gp7 family putative phage head morphogenesis protein